MTRSQVSRTSKLFGAMLCLAAAGCAAEPKEWTRPDGQPVNPTQLEIDRTACKGEVEKAAVTGQAKSTVDMPLGMDRQDMRVFKGCMASRGYLAAIGN
jgi:hypothetical protein